MILTLPKYKNTPETQLYVKIIKKGNLKSREVMLLLPGGPGGNHTVYNEICGELFKYCNLILFDPRGCGLSSPSDCKYCTLNHYVKDIELILNALEVDKITILGGSYGAMAGLKFSAEHPKRVKKFISLAGSPSGEFILLARKNLAQKGTKEQIQLAEKLWSGTFESSDEFYEYYQTMSPLYLYKQHPKEIIPPTIKPKVPYNIEIINLGFKQFLREYDVTDKLKNVLAETHLICGKNDWMNDPTLMIKTHELLPNSHIYLLEECGHFIWKDKKEDFYRILNTIFSPVNSRSG